MSESLVPKPPGSGGGGRWLLVVAGVMVAAVVGLLVFKSSGDPDAPSEQAPTSAPPPKPAPVTAEPPPPPPPPEAEPEPEPTKPQARPAPKNTGCSGECQGDVTPEITRILTGKARQARSCYNRALAQNSALSGSLMVAVRIGPRGEVCSSSVVNDTLGDSSVPRCVLQRFRTGSFPKPRGGCVDVQVPINFKAPE